MPLPIGLQLYTIRDLIEGQQLGDSLKKVADIGYTHCEVGPFSGHTTEEVTTAAREAGLVVVGSHEGDLALGDGVEALRTVVGLGIHHAIQPYLPPDQRTADAYRNVRDALLQLAHDDAVVLFHNHDWEFDQVDGDKTGYDILVNDTDLGAELDTCWVHVAGHDPVEQMKRLKGRLPLIHVKDAKGRQLTELGEGDVPVKAIVAAAEDCGVECLVVEQDNNWLKGDPMASIQKSYDYLKSIL